MTKYNIPVRLIAYKHYGFLSLAQITEARVTVYVIIVD